MTYREYPPQLALREHVECFWTMRTSTPEPPQGSSHLVLPDGCIDIIFDFSDSVRRYPSYVVGTMSRPIQVSMNGRQDILGVRFRPGASQSFLRLHAAECTDDTADLECFWGKTGAELWENLAGLPSSQARIAHLESYLLWKYSDNLELDPYVQYTVKLIENRLGQVSLPMIEKGTGLSARQIERKFARAIGLSPKTFARVIRFKNVASLANSSASPDWTTIALESGYSDQSHLIREFKEFSGITPSEFAAST